MILAVDIGNTNVKFGVFDRDNLLESFRMSVAMSKTSDEYGFNLMNMLSASGIKAEQIDGAILSSVNPHLNYTIEHMISYYFKVKPIVVGTGIKTGLNVKYDNPKEVGSDRIMSCVGAYHCYGGPCIVIDFGTATTFNAVSESGEFLGGAITFGLKTASDALSASAAKLPKVELAMPPRAIARNTINGMQSGIIHGFIGITEHMVREFRKEMNADVKVIATGGLSQIIASASDVISLVDRTLTLKGLNVVYKLNVK